MSGSEPSGQVPSKKSRNLRFVTAVIVIILALVGFLAYTTYQNSQCGFVGCGPVDEPVILSARAITPSWTYDCAVVTQSSLVVCQILASGGDSGTIVMNLTSQGGDSSVAFGTYSSESQYIHYTSTYSCLYSTTLPDLNSQQSRCPISQSGSTYRFNYTISQSLPPQQQVILTITLLKTCCWP